MQSRNTEKECMERLLSKLDSQLSHSMKNRIDSNQMLKGVDTRDNFHFHRNQDGTLAKVEHSMQEWHLDRQQRMDRTINFSSINFTNFPRTRYNWLENKLLIEAQKVWRRSSNCCSPSHYPKHTPPSRFDFSNLLLQLLFIMRCYV